MGQKQNKGFYCKKLNFSYLLLLWTCYFVNFERKSSFQLCLKREISYEICKYFLKFVSVDFLYQMTTGLSLYFRGDP